MEFDKSKKYYKIIRNDYKGGMYFQTSHSYHLGINIPSKQNPEIFFTNIENIFAYLSYGNLLCTIIIPDEATVVYEPEYIYIGGEEIPGWYSDIIEILSIEPITIKLIDSLIEQGSSIKSNNYKLFDYALYNNYNLWKHLIEKYPNIAEEVSLKSI